MLRLLLPALIPSWRFFDRIGPAPRIEFALTTTPDDHHPQWREVRPRPQHGSIGKMLVRLFWNRRRNEALYLVSCAERLVEDPTAWRAGELWSRAADMVREEARRTGHQTSGNADEEQPVPPLWLRVRIVESMRDGSRIAHDVVYESTAHPFGNSAPEAPE